MRKLRAIVLMTGLSALMVAPAGAFTDPTNSDIAPYTALSGAPMDAIKQAMETTHLGLSLRVDPKSKSIAGIARYTVQALSELNAVEFDLDPRFKITSISIDGIELGISEWRNDGGKLIIDLPNAVGKAGYVDVTISYGGQPRIAPNAPWDGGFVWAKTPAGQDWVATAVQGTGCDLFWPCLDHPTKRVGMLDLSVTVPAPLVVAANGRPSGVEHNGEWSTYRWQAKYPNDYGVSLQIGPYETVSTDYKSRHGNSYPITFWHLPGHHDQATRLVGEMEDYLDFFESKIGPYPFGDEKVGVAETPHKGMEHQTINAYGNKFVLSAEGYDELMQHEFSHEYFANQLTGKRVADLWLHEGLGTYMQPLYLDWKDGRMAYNAKMSDLRKRIVSKVPVAPAVEVQSTLYDDREKGWGGDIYYKGAWIAHTLRYLVGDEAFFRSLTRLVYGRATPKPGNFGHQVASTDDFQRIVEEEYGSELDWFFNTYLREAELPKLSVTRSGSRLSLVWETVSEDTFAMPVEIRIEGDVQTVAMPEGHATVTLPFVDAHVTIDPYSKVLRENEAIGAWRSQEAADRQKKQAK